MAQLIIIRGLPGSGKSTLAKRLNGFKHFEADMYHMKDGVYQWDPKNIKAAHQWCQDQVKKNLDAGHDVVVSNTFTQLWEMEPYFNMAHPFQVIECKSNFGNIHNVPAESIEKMRNRWQPYWGEDIWY